MAKNFFKKLKISLTFGKPSLEFILKSLVHRRHQGEDRKRPPTEIGKKLTQKNDVFFRRLYFLPITFPKLGTNSIFLLNCYQKHSHFSETFQTIWIFRPNLRKISAGFIKFCWKIWENNAFFHFLFLKVSQTIVFFVQTRENLTRGI